MRKCGFEFLSQSFYSPDPHPPSYLVGPATSTYILDRLKKHLRGQRYENDNEPTAVVEGWLECVCVGGGGGEG